MGAVHMYDTLTWGSLSAARTFASDDAIRLRQSICLGEKRKSFMQGVGARTTFMLQVS